MTKKELQKLIQKYRVPIHIQKHMEKVAAVSVFLAKKIIKNGYKINVKELGNAALLHDLVKLCDFPKIDLRYFEKKPVKKDIQFWQRVIRKYQKVDHAEAAYKILKEMGEEKIATIIQKHDFKSLMATSKNDRPQSLEEKILYYADKRVCHDRIVTLKKRLEDGRKRYFPNGNVPSSEIIIVQKLYQLEKELLKKAKIKPSAISEKSVKSSKI